VTKQSPLRRAVGSTSLVKVHGDTKRPQALVAGGKQPRRLRLWSGGPRKLDRLARQWPGTRKFCVDAEVGHAGEPLGLGPGAGGFDTRPRYKR
jgi:hypothetical protein